ncbi:MAG: hypothetical protein WCF28_12220 [Methanobacterium sp.]
MKLITTGYKDDESKVNGFNLPVCHHVSFFFLDVYVKEKKRHG